MIHFCGHSRETISLKLIPLGDWKMTRTAIAINICFWWIQSNVTEKVISTVQSKYNGDLYGRRDWKRYWVTRIISKSAGLFSVGNFLSVFAHQLTSVHVDRVGVGCVRSKVQCKTSHSTISSMISFPQLKPNLLTNPQEESQVMI